MVEHRTGTLQELLRERSTQDETWLICPIDPMRDASAHRWTFRQACHTAGRIAAALLSRGVEVGSPVVMISENGPQFVTLFLGIVHAGLVPVPMHTPLLATSLDEYWARVAHVMTESGARFIAVEDVLAEPTERFVTGCGGESAAWSELTAHTSAASLANAAPTDLAFVQYSSGSTRAPRGAMLTHANVLANVYGLGMAIDVVPEDVALCWLPLFHDMGLTATFLYSFFWGLPLVLMTPVEFITRPAAWLWAISRFGVTGCAAPNFAYALCASSKRVPDSQLGGLDLSSWRVAINGAEAIQRKSVDAFVDRFAPHGFRATGMLPAYGLAESTVACCLANYGQPLQIDQVSRRSLEEGKVARPAATTEPCRELVSVGTPIARQEVRVINSACQLCGERAIGEIQVRGASVMKGYLGGEEGQGWPFSSDGWLRTGDLGYLFDGALYVVGREKEIIKRAGAKYDAADMQAVVSEVPGVRPGCVAAFSVVDAAHGTEQVVIVAETKLREREVLDTLRQSVAKRLQQVYTLKPHKIVLIEAGSLPKSTSGKVQANKSRRLYERGELTMVNGGANADGIASYQI